MFKTVSTFLLFLCFSTLLAQSSKELYVQADAAMQTGDFESAIKYAEKAKVLLSRTNPKIESLLLSAYFYNQDFVKAKLAYETLLQITTYSTQNSVNFKAIMVIGESIDNSLEEIEKEFEKKQKQELDKRMREAKKIEKSYNEKNQTKKYTQQNYSAERKIYEKVKNSENLDDLKVYTKSFPKSTKFKKINQKIGIIEKEQFRVNNEEEVWTKSKQKNTVFAYENYLSIYYNGKHRLEAKKNIYQIKSARLYSKAQRSRDLDDYINYYTTYKRGKDFQAVKKTLLNYYLTNGNEAYQTKNWSVADQHYTNYLNINRSDSPEYLSKKIIKVKQMLKEKSFDFFTIHYDKYSHGVTFGSLLKDKLGGYVSIRGRSHYLFRPFEVSDIEFDEDVNSFELETGDYGSDRWKERYTRDVNNVMKQSFVGILGLSKKIKYPLWFNAGVGLGMYWNYQHVFTESYENEENDWTNYSWQPPSKENNMLYVLDRSYQRYRFAWEVGLKLVLFKKVYLSYGLTNSHGEVVHYFGIGAGGYK